MSAPSKPLLCLGYCDCEASGRALLLDGHSLWRLTREKVTVEMVCPDEAGSGYIAGMTHCDEMLEKCSFFSDFSKGDLLESDDVVTLLEEDSIRDVFDAFLNEGAKVKATRKKGSSKAVGEVGAAWGGSVKVVELVDGAVFPFQAKVLSVVSQSPMVLAVEVGAGAIYVNSPTCWIPPSGNPTSLGTIEAVENPIERVDVIPVGRQGLVRLSQRHTCIVPGSTVWSEITRNSIDLLKHHHRNDLRMEEWRAVQKVKKALGVPDASST
eukprot:Sspe_Gene.119518::Locus_115645_Transcript_1_1_Confidence_1.000_Length_966::g.119518::m.119518